MDSQQIILLILLALIVFVSFFCGYAIGRLTEVLKQINKKLKE